MKEAQSKAGDTPSGSEKSTLKNEKMKALIVKEQTKRKLTHLTREMSLSGGPPLSDTLDAKHWACYLVLEEEMNALA